jgi:hypothetical protein
MAVAQRPSQSPRFALAQFRATQFGLQPVPRDSVNDAARSLLAIGHGTQTLPLLGTPGCRLAPLKTSGSEIRAVCYSVPRSLFYPSICLEGALPSRFFNSLALPHHFPG